VLVGEDGFAAGVQDRKGPNRVEHPLTRSSLFGLGQPLGDGSEINLQGIITRGACRQLFTIWRTIVILAAAIEIFAVRPFGQSVAAEIPLCRESIQLVVARRRRGQDLGLRAQQHGAVLRRNSWAAGQQQQSDSWAVRSAQLIAFEIPLGLGILGVVISFRPALVALDPHYFRTASSGRLECLYASRLGLVVISDRLIGEEARLRFEYARSASRN